MQVCNASDKGNVEKVVVIRPISSGMLNATIDYCGGERFNILKFTPFMTDPHKGTAD